MTELVLKLIAALAAIADGLNNVASAIKGNGLAVPVQASLELKSEPAATGSVSPTLDKLKADAKAKEDAKANAGKTPETPKPSDTPKDTPPPANSGGTKAPSVDDLRKVGTALVADGKKTEFLAILAKFEAKNVTSVPEAKRGDCLAELEKALGKKLAELAD